MVNYAGLIDILGRTNDPFGLLTMQATSTTGRLMKVFPNRLQTLFSAEGGFFGSASPDGGASSAWHPYWNRPIHALTGSQNRPTPEMLSGLGRVVIDLCDIGVRSYPYLATLKGMLEACAETGVAVTVLDRQIPLGGVMDGPMRDADFVSPLAPLDVPFCHGMTPGECAIWIRNAGNLDINLTVAKLAGWSHAMHSTWPNFVPPSPDIPSWDSAALYPMAFFADACPTLDFGLDGPLAYRVIGAPWLDQRGIIESLTPGLRSCGVSMRPYRYEPSAGRNRGRRLDGILFTVSEPTAFYPVTAGVLVLTALLQRHESQIRIGSRPELIDRTIGSTKLRDTLERGSLDELFQSWIAAQDAWLATRVNLYKEAV